MKNETKMLTEKELKEFRQYIFDNSKSIRWDTCWTSGSSTEVPPVYSETQWNNEQQVIIQLITKNRYWYAKVRSFITSLKKKFTQYNIKWCYYQYDGSRPYELHIAVKKECA